MQPKTLVEKIWDRHAIAELSDGRTLLHIDRHFAALAAALERAREPVVTVDLQNCTVQGPEGWAASFSVPAERRTALIEGLDEIDTILRMEREIDAFQRAEHDRHPWLYPTRT